jgi:hypothetical protein
MTNIMRAKKSQLARKFQARYTLNGFALIYSNGRTEWTMYTTFRSGYDALSDADSLTYKELLMYRSCIISNALKKITIQSKI